MGMFDYIKCKYGPSASDEIHQTKAFDWPQMENYEIREDGRLYREDYDVEDRSDKNAPPGSLASICGINYRVNQRWVPCNWTGTIDFDEWTYHIFDGRVKSMDKQTAPD